MEQRAAAAAVCEPHLLKKPDEVKRVLQILDHITRSKAATRERKHEGFHVLRQARGYCWSVAAAANPEAARPLLEKWLRSSDPDIAWVMKSNLAKARMRALAKSFRDTPTRRPKPTPKPPTPPARRMRKSYRSISRRLNWLFTGAQGTSWGPQSLPWNARQR